MLLVKTKLGLSRVHGIGLFAAQFIPQDTVTWEWHLDFDTAYDEAEMARMPPAAREQFQNYSYFHQELGRYVLCFDDLRFINHSADAPNINAMVRRDVAARNIHEGEDLLCDYRSFDNSALLACTRFLRAENHNGAARIETNEDQVGHLQSL